MESLDAVIAPRGADTLGERELQRLLLALQEVLREERREWAVELRQLRVTRGDVAPLWRLLVRRATTAQARRYLDVFRVAFGVTR